MPAKNELNEAPSKALMADKVNLQAPVIKFDTVLYKQIATKLNIIRFIAICSIVWGHNVYAWEHKTFNNLSDELIQTVVLQLGRMGTVMFFVITGFFMADKLQSFSIIGYIRYRLYSLIIPWFIFLSAFVFIQIFHLMPLHQIFNTNIVPLGRLVLYLYRVFIFHATYWFIPVSIASSFVLIIFKKHINKWWFGIMLVCFALFYAVNLYYSWIPADHTKAVLGYVLFMWMGMQLRNHLVAVKNRLDSISWSAFASALTIMFCIACAEGMKLTHVGSVDPFASNRLSGATLSVLLFFALLKSNNLQWINKYFKPQNYVYGVYLIHVIIISEIMPVLYRQLLGQDLFASMPRLIAVQFGAFVFVMAFTYVLVMMVKRSPLYFTISRNRTNFNIKKFNALRYNSSVAG